MNSNQGADDDAAEVSQQEELKRILESMDDAMTSSPLSSENDVGTTQHQLRQETKDFLHTLSQYLNCRQTMDAKYNELLFVDDDSEYHQIANFPVQVHSGGIEESSSSREDGENDTNPLQQFKPEYLQQSIHGTPAQTLDELYEAATLAQPVYQDFIQGIVNQIQSSASEGANDENDEGIDINVVPLKTRDRALEKAEDDYAQRLPGPSLCFLYDIVRGSIEFSSSKDLLQCLELIENHPLIHIVKAKNRFKTPSLTGYRDVNLQIQIPIELEEYNKKTFFKHICEIQLHHTELKRLSNELGSHKHYEYFRSYFAGSTNTLEERLEDLKVILQGSSSSGSSDNALFLQELLENRELDEERLERLGKLFHVQLSELPMALRAYKKLLDLRVEKYHGDPHASIAKAYHDMAGILVDQGKLHHAMVLCGVSLDMKRQLHNGDGPGPSMAETLQRMAMILRDQDELDESMMLYEKTLEIQKEAFHKDHNLSVGTTLRNMGKLLKKQGKLQEAMEHYENALRIIRASVGDEHSSVGQVYGNMALVLHVQCKYEESLSMYRRSIEISSRALGEDHVSIAKNYHNMAEVFQDQGKLDEAIALFTKSLELKTKRLGDEHKSVANTYTGLACVFQKQGSYDKSMEWHAKALDIKEKALGGKHSSIAKTYCSMAMVLREQDRFDEAMELLEQSLIIRKDAYGPNHRLVAESYQFMGMVHKKQDKLDEAMENYNLALEILEGKFGRKHGSVSRVLHSMALARQKQGAFQEAKSLFQESLQIDQDVLGREHPLIAKTMHNMGESLQAEGKLEEAMDMLSKSLEMKITLLGGNHPSVANTFNAMAIVLNKEGKLDQSLAMFEKSLELKLQHRGARHSTVGKTLKGIASVLRDQDRLEESLEMYQRSLDILLETLGEGSKDAKNVQSAISELQTCKDE